MAMFQSRYGKPVMQVEFGGPENTASQVESDLETYWPFASYGMGAWHPSTKEPTAALNGFPNA